MPPHKAHEPAEWIHALCCAQYPLLHHGRLKNKDHPAFLIALCSYLLKTFQPMVKNLHFSLDMMDKLLHNTVMHAGGSRMKSGHYKTELKRLGAGPEPASPAGLFSPAPRQTSPARVELPTVPSAGFRLVKNSINHHNRQFTPSRKGLQLLIEG